MTSKLLEKKKMFHFHRIATTLKHRSHVFRSRTIGDRTGAETTTAESLEERTETMAIRQSVGGVRPWSGKNVKPLR